MSVRGVRSELSAPSGGIESGDKSVRLEVDKGKFEDVDVRKVINKIHESDINVMANYIYGLPGDTRETVEKTFQLSLELCTAGWNTWSGSSLNRTFTFVFTISTIEA